MEAIQAITGAPAARPPYSRWRRREPSLKRIRQITALPPALPAPAVRYSGKLVGFVAGLTAVAGLLAAPAVLAGSHDWVGGALAGLTVAGVALYAVPSLGGMNTKWSTSGFFHLAFSFAVGPTAIVAMAVCQSAAGGLRRRSGWIRFAFNVANHSLADLAAWASFHAIIGQDRAHGWTLFLAGVLAGVVELVVNYGLIAVVLFLSDDFALRDWLRAVANLAPYSLGFGFAAAGTILVYHLEGPLGIFAFVVPIGLIQMALVALTRGVQAHALEREALSERALNASEMERVRIAADLHDGVVQDLAALSYTCSAFGRLEDGMSERERTLIRTLIDASEVTRMAMRDLRTLMVELAPPRLREDGLKSALEEVLSKIERQGRIIHLECPDDPRLGDRAVRLAYRVVQEALRNISRHAQCEHVWVSVRPSDHQVVVEIRDDGRGFSAEEQRGSQRDGHNGLGLLAQTVKDGGAELMISSAPGEGTTITMTVPVAGAAA